MTLDELDKFIGLVIARGILGQRGLPVESCGIQPGCGKFVGYNGWLKNLSGQLQGKILEKMQLHKETSLKLTIF